MAKENEMGIKPKQIDIDISSEMKLSVNDRYVKDLMNIFTTYSTEPTHEPKKIVDCFYFYKNDATYRLYIYLNNEWKYVNLT